ncbi:hypothetical protein RND71_024910 [Anisodus tanguticus]|uniref:Uncharacterized protein n=1 Tax=Anisodus tanguticus TaxID=243964 RepID=A0AAE1RRH7_9SOLA|nr:hypothetical protein RND71_024910 [Anisodus tanguticus]
MFVNFSSTTLPFRSSSSAIKLMDQSQEKSKRVRVKKRKYKQRRLGVLLST